MKISTTKKNIRTIFSVLTILFLLQSTKCIQTNRFSSLHNNISPEYYEPYSFIQTPSQQGQTKCDLDFPNTICLFNNEKILLPDNVDQDLIGFWNFNEIRAIDKSKYRNDGISMDPYKSGPSVSVSDATAYLSGGNYIQIPHIDIYNTQTFTMSFFLFIYESYSSNLETPEFCPLIIKGEDSESKFERAPSIFYNTQNKNIKVALTFDEDSEEGQFIESKSKLFSQRWFHIAVTYGENKLINRNVLKLYINGILDSTKEFRINKKIIYNKSPIYIGNSPSTKENCELLLLFDIFKFYNKTITESEIRAEAYPVLGGISPNNFAIGCIDCTLEQSKVSCPIGYKLCTSTEIRSGGYQVARGLGLLNWDTYIWGFSALNDEESYEGLKGLTICCRTKE